MPGLGIAVSSRDIIPRGSLRNVGNLFQRGQQSSVQVNLTLHASTCFAPLISAPPDRPSPNVAGATCSNILLCCANRRYENI